MNEERVRGRILRSVNGGYGLLRADGKTVFVRDALRGEDVTAVIRSKRKGVLFADVAEIHVASEGRRTAPCEVAYRCGGCQFQGATEDAQKDAKREALEELLRRARIETPVSDWHRGPESGWRSRVELHGVKHAQGFALGFFEEKSHRVVQASGCLQVSDTLRALIQSVTRVLADSGVREASVELVESFDRSARVAATPEPMVAEALRRSAPGLGLAGLGLRASRDEAQVLDGDLALRESIHGVTLTHRATSFFQANRFLTESLVRRVVSAAGETANAPVIDLFSGVGLFALPMAKGGRRVTAIEWNRTALDDLARNAAANEVEIEIVPLSVGTALASGLELQDSVVIADPPRRGLEAHELQSLADGSPATIVYVSCDPATLTRDLVRLHGAGYVTRTIEAFDMFPTTFHLETIATLSRA